MLDGPLVFLDIDTQRDFLDPGGALFITGSEPILSRLARLTEFARSHAVLTIATACAHHPDDPEFAVFGPHCLIGTWGQERVAATASPDSMILGVADRLATIPVHLTVEKVTYDLFRRSDAGEIMARYAHNTPTFVVYGVATDYCVRCAVEGLLARGYRVALVVDAIAAIDRQNESQVLTAFAQAGVLLTLTDVVCDDHSDA